MKETIQFFKLQKQQEVFCNGIFLKETYLNCLSKKDYIYSSKIIPMKSVYRILAACLMLTLLFSSCKKKESKEPEKAETPSPLPVVSTSGIDQIDGTSASGGGQVSSEGSSALTKVGICWDVDHNPTTLRPHTDVGAGTGSFNSAITGLTPNTTYYVRAYATNASGTAYGNEVSFKTLPSWAFLNIQSSNYPLFLFYQGNKIFGLDYDGSMIISSDEGAGWSYGPSQGNVMGITNNGSALFCLTVPNANKIYMSTDNGDSWTHSGTAPTSTTVSNFIFNDIVASSSAIYLASINNGIFKSTDNGSSWNTINTNLQDLEVRKLTINESVLLAITGNDRTGLFLSTDGGSNWAPVNNGLSNKAIYSAAISGSSFFVSTEDGNYTSTNSGSTWTKINNKLGNINVALVFETKGNNVLAYGNDISGNNNAMFFSKDNGLNWVPIRTGLYNLKVSSLALGNTKAYCMTSNKNFYKLDLP